MPLRLVFVAESPTGPGPVDLKTTLTLAWALLDRFARDARVPEEVLRSVPRRFTLNLLPAQSLRSRCAAPEEALSSSPAPPVPGARLRLAVTWLCESEAFKLAEWSRGLSFDPLPLAAGPIRFMIAPVSWDAERNHPGKTWIPYATILAKASATLRQVTLKFCTPTLLFRKGRPYPLPDPSLVFRAYLDLWNVFSPLALTPDLGPAIDHDLELTDFRLRRRPFGVPPTGQAAFGGSATFSLRGRHPESVLKGLNALADFAEFCGTGAGTDVGMGLTKRVQRVTRPGI